MSHKKKKEETRVGVYVCNCGLNIAATVDCDAVAAYAEGLDGVVVSRSDAYLCSEPGQQLIKKDIAEQGINRVVVGSCTPRLHEPTFRKCLEGAGLSPYLLEMANLREQCSWVHAGDREGATAKARDLIRCRCCAREAAAAAPGNNRGCDAKSPGYRRRRCRHTGSA